MPAPIFEFPPTDLPVHASELREEVRRFVREERDQGRIGPAAKVGMSFDADFSRRCGERGYIGMTWPKHFGGAGRTALERYVVTEELLSAGAPVRGHWTSDRQSGPVILRYGTDLQKEEFLPRIARGDCFFCIGLSEPNSGSDLASVKSRALRSGDGWILNGSKLWTTNAHNSHYIIALCRTTPQDEQNRYHGLTQFIIDLSSAGVTVRPIKNMAGERDFNEVIFRDVALPKEALLGTLDEGWNQVSAELSYERSGPERWLTTFRLLTELNAAYGSALEPARRQELGRLFAHLVTLREMSLSISGMLQAGQTPNLEAAIVKDLGTVFEREVITVARDILAAACPASSTNSTVLHMLMESALLFGPALSIRGGTTEILRNTIARGLNLR
jgi:alkylation response protein AidB-like acyl-CoA dehydrogenase